MEPIGLQLRKRKLIDNKVTSSSSQKQVSLLSIDEQIALLQKNVTEDSGDDDSGSGSESDTGSGSDSEGDYSTEDEFVEGFKVIRDSEGNIVKMISALEEGEKIKPLPKKYLPAARCNTSGYSESAGKDGTRKRAIRFQDEPTPEQVAISGMEKTVREMLAHYEPASHDKRPFYCRVCCHQAGSVEELEAHKLTDFHAVAVRLERSRSYCKHCEKQFTSPDQLKGHIEGKAHKEKVARMAARKRGNYSR
jgi:hypothetical protein